MRAKLSHPFPGIYTFEDWLVQIPAFLTVVQMVLRENCQLQSVTMICNSDISVIASSNRSQSEMLSLKNFQPPPPKKTTTGKPVQIPRSHAPIRGEMLKARID